MNKVELECPQCGSNLEISKEGLNVCKYCNNQFYVENKKGNIIINTTINNYNQKNTPTNKKNIVISYFVTIAVFISVSFFGLFFNGFFNNKNIKSDIIPTQNFVSSVTSEYMIDFCKEVFKKDIDNLEKSDYEKVKYISIVENDAYDYFTIYYKLEDGVLRKVNFYSDDTDGKIPLYDFQAFTSLESLDLSNSGYIVNFSETSDNNYKNNLKNLKNLKEFNGNVRLDIADISDIVYDVSNIVSAYFNIYDGESFKAELSKFTSLENLGIHYVSEEAYESLVSLSELNNLKSLKVRLLPDNSYLSGIVSLKELYIAGSQDNNNYSVLYGMPNLEVLEIYGAYGLKTIDFTSGMPKLKSLRIDNSEIKNIDVLKNNNNIVKLALTYNDDIASYEIIKTLTNLEELHVDLWWVNNSTPFPMLDSLPNLKKLYISSDWINKIGEKSNISELILDIKLAMELDINSIPKLKNLQTLKFIGDGYIYNLDAISKLENLKELSFEKCRLYFTDVSPLLSSKSIKKLSFIDSSSLSIDMSKISDNNTLEYLYLNDTESLYSYNSAEKNRDSSSEVNLGDKSSIFSKLYALKELTIINGYIEDLKFVENMKSLEYLNLNNNYIQDISPLLDLENLEIVSLKNNPVANSSLLDEKVTLLK